MTIQVNDIVTNDAHNHGGRITRYRVTSIFDLYGYPTATLVRINKSGSRIMPSNKPFKTYDRCFPLFCLERVG